MSAWSVVVVQPPGYPHSAAFLELGESLVYALVRLGHDAILTTDPAVPGRRPIVLGSNLLAAYPLPLPGDAILYNLEQIEPGSPWLGPALLELFRRHEVWDYSARNAARYADLGLPPPRVVPVGWVPELTRIAPAPEQDLDVLFYGSLNERRQRVLDALRARGLRVEAAFGVYGAARDALVARAKVVLNVHHYDAKVFEIVRVSYLLANRRCVVSERGADLAEERAFEAGVAFAPYDGLVETCVRLVADPEARARIAEEGFRIMSARPATAALAAALGEPGESPAAFEPWAGSRERRLLVAPAPEGDVWAEALPALVAVAGAMPDLTIGVALPAALLADPPEPVRRAAEAPQGDLLLLEAPPDDAGWERVLAGATEWLVTSDRPALARLAARLGVPATEAPALRRARPPAAGSAEDARARYLDLMKRCLANTIYRDADQLRGRYSAASRAAGLDWPEVAHTMVGEARLENVQRCVEDALARGVPGDLIETGVWRGGTVIFMRAILAAHGDPARRVFAADSFEGLPPPDAAKYPADAGDRHHTFEQLAVSREQVEENFRRYGLLDDRVRFLQGWFKDTLPSAPIDRLAVIRLDGDMYESTMDAIVALYPKLSPGGWLIVDDYGAVPGCRKAIHDYRAAHGITEPIQTADWTGVYWRKAA